jgi:hypothetical protein
VRTRCAHNLFPDGTHNLLPVADTAPDLATRLAEATRRAHAAEERGDEREAADAWHLYRLLEDAQLNPDERLRRGIALSAMALDLRDAG